MFHMGFFLISVGVYFLPTIVAVARHKTNVLGIFLVNFFLGWSVIGWIVALVWAVSTERVDQPLSPQMTPLPQPARRFCTKCGQPDQMGSQFCAHCGAPLR